MAAQSEVVIVGAGIVGCATAYYLAKRGVKATIIEKEAVASCASGFSAGLLNPLHCYGVTGPLEGLARESFEMHLQLAEELGEETGVDHQFRSVPSVYLAFDDVETRESREVLELAQKAQGFQARCLEAQEIHALEPRLSRRAQAGVFVEGTRQVASYEYTLALLQAAEKRGANLRHGTVQGIKGSRGRVAGVVVSGEEVPCDKVVLAMGPWTGQVENWLGVRMPVYPLKGQILRLKLPGAPLDYVFYHSGGYVAPTPDGLTWAGTTEERVGFDDRPTAEARESITKGAMEVMPSFSEAQLTLQTACLRPASDDGLPILGEVPGWDGVYVATGAGRDGILLGPAMARATADLVTEDRTELPVKAFSLSRFATVR